MPVDDQPPAAEPANAVRPGLRRPTDATVHSFADLFAEQRGAPPLSAEIRRFPERAILRRVAHGLVGDQVRVTHAGETQVYETVGHLYAFLRGQDDELETRLTALRHGGETVDRLTAEASAALADANAQRTLATALTRAIEAERAAAKADREAAATARAQAERRLRIIGRLGLAGLVCGLVWLVNRLATGGVVS